MTKFFMHIGLGLFATSTLLLACSNSMPKDDFNYPLRAHDITEGSPYSSGVGSAGEDLRRNNQLEILSNQIVFAPGSSKLSDDTKAALDQIAQRMKTGSESFERIRVAGYGDAGGSASKNLTLSQSRADNIKKYLVSQGVPDGKLEAIGMGSTGLNVPGDDKKTARSRVDFVIVH
ncbi:OmpA family protein [Bdellovibrio sp. NC01]|uniref:OmpA family protein n=1 Tax=Bdellovibrio sp. NC01 TaxID=2220073 RepID=UPI0011585698|nr:OmpA family protein [Bdellovibrio sp. NC01]QDK36454.1 hypothetical protein DOE51_01985 [Bdellovibrio sp. NC01]